MLSINQKSVLRWVAFLLGASFCFVQLGIFAFGRFWTLGTIVTALYLLLLLPKLKFFLQTLQQRRSLIALPFVWIVLLTIVNGFYYNPLYGVPIVNTTIIMCFVLYVFMLVHLKQDISAANYLLYGFVFGNIIMSFLFLAGIGVEIDPTSMRLQMFGSNSNQLGVYMSYSIIVIVNDWILRDTLKLLAFRWGLILLLIPQGVLLLATASRTAFLIVVLALICIVLLYKTKRLFVKILFIIAGCWLIMFGYSSIMGGDSTLATRMETTTDENNLSGRDSIWDALFPYVSKHPLFGVGQTGYVEVSMEALSETKITDSGATYGFSPHNVLLEILLYTGIVGLVIMLLFWGKIGLTALKIYINSTNTTLLLCLIPVMGCIVSGQILGDKVAWMLYACIAAYVFRTKRPSRI